MKSVSVKEARLFEQWANTTLAWVKRWEILQYEQDKEIILKARKKLWESDLYKEVWWAIEKMAEMIVNTKCKPEWEKISEKMRPLWDERNTLAKEKAENPDWWTDEKEERVKELDKKMSELTEEYQKVTDEANAELNEYKEKKINEEQWWCFFLEDDEYDIVGRYTWWVLPKIEE